MAPDLSFLTRLAPADPVPDAELLRRFAAGDGPAFELLVRRHAGLVWRVCRSVLSADAHAAEDAFQASFLALARRAGRVRGASAAGWLARVARHAALRRRNLLARTPAPLPRDLPTPPSADPAETAEVSAAVLAEVARLPARLREPVLVCLLEGCSHAEAAARLGLPVGTVASRLSRARGTLRGRLLRRGLAPAALAAVAPAPAAVVRAGAVVGLDPSSASPAVSTLAAGAVSAMSAAFRLKVAAGLVLAVGAVTLSLAAPTAGPQPPAPAAKPNPAADDLAKFQGKWKVVSIRVPGKKTTPADVAGMTWTFAGDTTTGSGPGEKPVVMRFRLDPAKSPKWIDLTGAAPDGEEGKSAGIYKLDGDRLTLCLRDEAAARKHGRPTEFALDGDAAVLELARAGTDPPPTAPVPPPKPAAPAADELAKLQGKWRVTRLSMADQSPPPGGMTLTVAGDVATREGGPDGRRDRMTLTLDPGHKPKRIALTPLPGDKPAPDDGQVFRGIYKLDGDTLIWCVRDPQATERFGRPTEFVVGGGSMVMELVRADAPAVSLAAFQGDWRVVTVSLDGQPPTPLDGQPPTPLVGKAARRMRVREDVRRVRVREDVVWFDNPPGEQPPHEKMTLVGRPAPGEIDLVPLTGLDAVRGKTLPGRYELAGDRLTLSLGMASIIFPRPADLKPGRGRIVVTLEREPTAGAKLVGEWQQSVQGKAAGDTLMVWTFRDTGVFRIDYLDKATGKVNVGPFAGGLRVGRWRLDGAELVLETEGWVGDDRRPHRSVERLPVEAVTADTLVVRRLPDPRGTRWVTETYTRFPGWEKSAKP